MGRVLILTGSLLVVGASLACGSASDSGDSSDAGAGSDSSAADSGTADAGAVSDAASALADAVAPALGTCSFTVDGVPHQNAAGDPFTLATLADGGLTVQCVATSDGTRQTINLAVNGVSGPTTVAGLGQYSEQPAAGGTVTQYRNFAAPVTVSALDANAVSGRSEFSATGASDKAITVTFTLALTR